MRTLGDETLACDYLSDYAASFTFSDLPVPTTAGNRAGEWYARCAPKHGRSWRTFHYMEHGQDMELSPHPTVVMRALLIDLDNCPRQIERLPETLTEYARVIACYGGAEPKVPLGMVPLLATALHEGRLAIIGMQKKGKNAADFGLAFWAGRLAAEMPPDTFLILSQDTDLDHVVHMLQGANRRVERLDGKVHRTKRLSPDPPKPR